MNKEIDIQKQKYELLLQSYEELKKPQKNM